MPARRVRSVAKKLEMRVAKWALTTTAYNLTRMWSAN